MKKLSLYITFVLAVLGLASCSQDRDPVYQVPTTYVCNDPVMQNEYFNLTAGNTLEFSTTQPDYGYSAVAQYSAELSTTADFKEYYAIPALTPTMARFTIDQNKVAVGVCKLLNITSQDQWDAENSEGLKDMTLYFRAVCQLAGVESSLIKSNVVTYNHVSLNYFAEEKPGVIYLVGTPSGWASPDDSNAAFYTQWALSEDEDKIGSKIYQGEFQIDANPTFRFYTALTGWDNGASIGSQKDDAAMEKTFENGSFSGKIVAGKGSFNFTNWPGGKMRITIDLSDENNMTIKCAAVE